MTHKSIYLFPVFFFASFFTEGDDFLVEKTVFIVIKIDAFLQVTIGDTFGFLLIMVLDTLYIPQYIGIGLGT